MNRKNEVSDNFIEISFQVGTATLHNLSSLDKIGKTFLLISASNYRSKRKKLFIHCEFPFPNTSLK